MEGMCRLCTLLAVEVCPELKASQLPDGYSNLLLDQHGLRHACVVTLGSQGSSLITQCSWPKESSFSPNLSFQLSNKSVNLWMFSFCTNSLFSSHLPEMLCVSNDCRSFARFLYLTATSLFCFVFSSYPITSWKYCSFSFPSKVSNYLIFPSVLCQPTLQGLAQDFSWWGRHGKTDEPAWCAHANQPPASGGKG